MNFSDITINDRQFTVLHPLAQELNFNPQKNYLFDLSYLSTISVEGERASEFLQGQLSCNVAEVNSETIRQGAMCNLQGRILALLDVVAWQGLQLVLPKDLITATLSSLSKTAMLSRVKLTPNPSLQIFGFYLANEKDLLPTGIPLPLANLALKSESDACCYQLSNQLYLIFIQEEKAVELKESFEAKQQLRGSLAWHHLQLEAKRVEIYPKTRGLFLPHRLDLHLSGYLSFDKGCYKGQEIIARTHYKAKRKHSLELFTIKTTEPVKAGAKLFSATGETEVGELIDYCPFGSNEYLIAVSILLDKPKTVLIEGHSEVVLLE